MPRIDLPELEDQTWFPPRLRNLMTEFLYLHIDTFDIYRPIVGKLAAALRATTPASGAPRVVDLCSGGSGPWRRVLARLAAEHDLKPQVTLSDLYPNIRAFERIQRAVTTDQISYMKASVDATAVPDQMQGFRTLFTCIHHFSPDLVGRIFQDAIDKGQGIGAFELSERHPLAMLSAMLGSGALPLLTPFLRPWRWDRFLFTNVVPVVPACFAWDGFASQFRSYTPQELSQIIQPLRGADTYTWDFGQAPHPWLPMRITYILGTPN